MSLYNFRAIPRKKEEVPVAYLDRVEDVFDRVGLIFEVVNKYNIRRDFSGTPNSDVFAWLCRDYRHKGSIADVKVLRHGKKDILEVWLYTRDEEKAKKALEGLNKRFGKI